MRAARVRAPGSSPSHLGPPKARISGLVWARRAPLMLMMRGPAVRIMRSRPRAEAASSNLLALHRAVQKPAPTPHGTRARFAAIHQLISSFRVRAGDPAGARITSISGTLAARRRRVGGLCRPRFLKASPLRLRLALAAQGGAGPQSGRGRGWGERAGAFSSGGGVHGEGGKGEDKALFLNYTKENNIGFVGGVTGGGRGRE